MEQLEQDGERVVVGSRPDARAGTPPGRSGRARDRFRSSYTRTTHSRLSACASSHIARSGRDDDRVGPDALRVEHASERKERKLRRGAHRVDPAPAAAPSAPCELGRSRARRVRDLDDDRDAVALGDRLAQLAHGGIVVAPRQTRRLSPRRNSRCASQPSTVVGLLVGAGVAGARVDRRDERERPARRHGAGRHDLRARRERPSPGGAGPDFGRGRCRPRHRTTPAQGTTSSPLDTTARATSCAAGPALDVGERRPHRHGGELTASSSGAASRAIRTRTRTPSTRPRSSRTASRSDGRRSRSSRSADVSTAPRRTSAMPSRRTTDGPGAAGSSRGSRWRAVRPGPTRVRATPSSRTTPAAEPGSSRRSRSTARTTRLTINRSPDGSTWSNALVAAEERAPQGISFDKNWIACDNGSDVARSSGAATSPTRTPPTTTCSR